MNYIRLFDTINEFNNYKQSIDFHVYTPNICLCKNDLRTLYYCNELETKVVAIYNITSRYNKTVELAWDDEDEEFYSTEMIESIEIDGVLQENVTNMYTFSTTGKHVVKYTMKDPTTLPYFADNKLIFVYIPNSVISIGDSVFYDCSKLKSIYTIFSNFY